MKIGLIIIAILFLGIVGATQICQTYDDFSSNTLNTDRWNESTFHNRSYPDQHNVTNGVYIVIQNTQGDREVNLIPNKQFKVGDSFSYGVNYYNGTGNHFSQPLINGNYPPSQIEPCLASGGCGPVGYWNGLPDLNKIEGIYKIKYEFSIDQVKMTAVRPDNVTIVNTFTGNFEPYTLSINTHTGHDGTMHFDYDNFVFCYDQPQPSLEDRVTILEGKVVELESKVDELESRTSLLEKIVDKIAKIIRNLPKDLIRDRID